MLQKSCWNHEQTNGTVSVITVMSGKKKDTHIITGKKENVMDFCNKDQYHQTPKSLLTSL